MLKKQEVRPLFHRLHRKKKLLARKKHGTHKSNPTLQSHLIMILMVVTLRRSRSVPSWVLCLLCLFVGNLFLRHLRTFHAAGAAASVRELNSGSSALKTSPHTSLHIAELAGPDWAKTKGRSIAVPAFRLAYLRSKTSGEEQLWLPSISYHVEVAVIL